MVYNKEKTSYISSSVIELPTNGRRGYIQISAQGFSFHKDIQATADWIEDANKKSTELHVNFVFLCMHQKYVVPRLLALRNK